MDTDLSHEANARFEDLEARVSALEGDTPGDTEQVDEEGEEGTETEEEETVEEAE